MKSDRHAARMALTCSGLGCCASPGGPDGGTPACGWTPGLRARVVGGAPSAGGAPSGGCASPPGGLAAGPPDSLPGGGAAPAIAATARRHEVDKCDEFSCRHCTASTPPGCTPRQCAMKSDRHAVRTALTCSGLGCASLGGEPDGGEATCGWTTPGLRRVGGGAASAGGAPSAGCTSAAGCAGAACADPTAAWHGGDRAAALAFKQSKISGLSGLIHEQCAMKSLSVQACRTALS
jgi:hypothetical protein